MGAKEERCQCTPVPPYAPPLPIKITRQTPPPHLARYPEVPAPLTDYNPQVRRWIMAIMENYDQEMVRLWGIISDLSDQLNLHRATASALRNQAEGIRVSPRHRSSFFCSGGPRTECSSVLEPNHSHPNWFRLAQVWVRNRHLILNYAHRASVKVQYG